MRWTTGLPHVTLTAMPTQVWLARAWRLVASLILAIFCLGIFHAHAAAQIVLDGTMNEPDWHLLGTSNGGPEPGFGPGNEINALYADIDATYFYIGMAGNVQPGNRILVFIDSLSSPVGYNNSNFGRNQAPPGINNFNPTSGNMYTQFDSGFTPNYVLVIGAENGYRWDLYTLSGTLGSGGGPNLLLGFSGDADLRANPANDDLVRGFEARLTYSASGSGVDIAINQPVIRMMAMYINDNGTLSNQFISRASQSQGNLGAGIVLFQNIAPSPVSFSSLVVVNEIDYIQPGANVGEFVELKNISSIPVNLNSYSLRFARGAASPPDIYREIDLPDIILNPNDYFVICTNATNVPNCDRTVDPPQDLLENALPAAVALFQGNAVVDTLSYGGNTDAPYTEGSGLSPADTGTQQGLGISRLVDGVDTNRNSVDFGLRCTTPGQINSTQSSACGPETPTFTPTPTPSSTASTPTPTGTPTNTSTPTPTGSVTATPTGSVTPGLPAGCSNILVNGNFEGVHGWEFGGSPVPGKYTSIPVHGGIRAVQLGIPPESGYAPTYSYSSIRQAVSIPRGSTVQLRWWHYHRTDLPELDNTDNTQARQEVILLKPNGDTLRVVQRVRYNDNSWQQDIIDLTEYAGHSFVLYFNVLNYGSGHTWTFLDDIELLVCPPQGSTAASGAAPKGTGDIALGEASTAYYNSLYGTPVPTATTAQQATATQQSTPTATPSATGDATENVTPTPSATQESTVTPTNTGSPSSPTPTPTDTTQAFAPNAPVDSPQSQTATPQPIAALQVAPTPAVQLVAERPAIPDNCIEVVDNGTFEARGAGWSQEGGTILPVFDTPLRNADAGAPRDLAIRLGLVDEVAVAGISAMQQLVQLPATSNKITLRFRYFPQFTAPLTSGDFQYVDIYHGESGQFVGRALGVQQDTRTWTEREIDLSAMAGEPLRVYFMVSNDGVGGNIAMYIDDVSILACRVPQPPNALAAGDAPEPHVAANAAPPQAAVAQSVAADAQPPLGFAFGRMGGLLAVLGIAGAALLLLPITRRLTKH